MVGDFSEGTKLDRIKEGHRVDGEVAWWLKALATLAEAPDSEISFQHPNQATHNCLYFQLLGNLMPSSGFYGNCMHMVRLHCRQNKSYT